MEGEEKGLNVRNGSNESGKRQGIEFQFISTNQFDELNSSNRFFPSKFRHPKLSEESTSRLGP